MDSVSVMIERLRNDPERLAHLLALAVWVIQPFTLGPLLGDALDPARTPFRSLASWGLWIIWLVVLVAMALPRPLTLTVVRLGVPAAIPAAVWAALESDSTSLRVAGLVSAVAATLIVMSPAIADLFIDGGSYGEERRFALRPPGPVLIGVVVPAAIVAVAGIVVGPLLLADERWIAGAIAVVVGFPLAAAAIRALHQLARRFVVFVPRGLVVHDLTVMREPVLFPTREIFGLAPALADTVANDFTNSALGLALELKLKQSIKVSAVTGRTETEERAVRALLISPSRPAAVMRFAQARDIQIA